MARSLMRKLGTFWRNYLSRPTIIDFIQDIPRNDSTSILFEPEFDYDTIDEFKDGLKAAFSSAGRSKARKQLSAAHLQELLEEIDSLEKSSSASKSRSVDSDDARPVKRQRNSGESGAAIPIAQQVLLKILSYMLASFPESVPFRDPVDRSLYPNYYAVIEQPMDLSTFRKSIVQFTTISEALGSLRLIWHNCLAFNVDDSPIVAQAKALAAEAEQFVVDYFGRDLVDEKWYLPAVRREFRARHLASLNSILNQLMTNKLSAPFLDPVDPKLAPGYTEVIDTAMDLNTVKNRLDTGFYNLNVSAFIEDVKLIWANCLEYNDPEAKISRSAEKMELLSSKLVAEHGLTHSKEQSESLMEYMLLQMEACEYIGPFLYPVNTAKVKDYLSVISKPMDISTVKKKLSSGAYSSFSAFVSDMHLIWSNCKHYNMPKSQLYDWAARCEKTFNQILVSKPSAGKSSLTPASPDVVEEEMDEVKADEELDDEEEDIDEQHSPDDMDVGNLSATEEHAHASIDGKDDLEDADQFPGQTSGNENAERSKSKRKRHHVSFRVRKYRSVLRQLLLFDAAEPFKATGLMPIRERIESYQDSPLRFFADIMAVFDSHAENKNDLSTSKSAMVCKQFAEETFYKNFPSLLNSKDTNWIVRNNDRAAESSNVGKQQQSPSFSYISIPNDFSSIPLLNRENSISSPNPLAPSCDFTVQEIDSMLSNIDEETIVRVCANQCGKLLSEAVLPFTVFDGAVEVVDFGAHSTSWNSDRQFYLCPEGFESKVTCAIALVDNASGEQKAEIPLILKARIHTVDSNPMFSVFTESDVLVSQHSSPLDAWAGLVDQELPLVLSLGRKLARCRAVLNRLTVSPDAPPFVDKVPLHGIGVHYYQVIKAPMWLREVHKRLVSGQYENEFDFAWDMRLIFRNCCEYNTPDSDLFNAAKRLSQLFELLFSRWILSVVDLSIVEPAHGPWDSWMSLVLYDGESKERVKKRQEACVWCKDLCVGKPREDSVCERCSLALRCGKGSLASNPFATNDFAGEVSSIRDGPVFVPAPDIGEGWCQTKPKHSRGSKVVYLSPLGYDVKNSHLINDQKKFEETVNTNLLAAREKEFAEEALHPRKRGSGIGLSHDAENMATMGFAIGLLHSFSLPGDCHLSLLVPSIWNNGGDRRIALNNNSVKDLPASGLFGLQIPEVSLRLQGLKGFEQCEAFISHHKASLIEFCRNELSQMRIVQSEVSKSVVHLMSEMCRERWALQLQRYFPVEPSVSASMSPSLAGFRPFLLGNLPHSILESMLVVWDFVDAISDRIGFLNFSLLDLMKSINPPSTLLTNCSQIVFDEVCCVLSSYLLGEVRSALNIRNETAWQDILLTLPINLITWPTVAERVVFIMCLPGGSSFSSDILHYSLSSSKQQLLKVLVLFCCHPLYESMLELCENAETAVQKLMQRIFSSDSMSAGDLVIELKALCDAFEVRSPSLAQHYLQWLAELGKRWNITSSVFGADGEQMQISDETIDSKHLRDRSWGGYTLRYCNLSSPFVLKFGDFDATQKRSPWQRKMSALGNLERFLSIVSKSESEYWNVTDRVAVLSTLVDFGMATSHFDQRLQAAEECRRVAFSSVPITDLDEDMLDDANVPSGKPLNHIPKKAKCVFSGLSAAVVPESSEWTTVSINNFHRETEISRFTRVSNKEDMYYVLKKALWQVNECKKAALVEFEEQQEKDDVLEKNLKAGTIKDVFVDIPYAAKLRGLPIGYDRWGNSFWLLAVQESMTIFPFDHSGRALDPADQSTTEPCILCRDMNGTWSYNNGCKLADLLDTFSEEYPCEMLLKAKLIERFHTVRSKLRVFTQQIKPTHQSWLEKKISLERWVAEMTLYGGPNESHRCRQLEVVWARCGESRINLLCGMIGNHSELNSDKFPLAFQSEILHRTKFSQPLSIEDSFDHHHTKGWNRADLFSKIRQIAASTTASCLLADGQSAQSLQASLAKSQFLQKNESTVPQNFNSESVTNKLVAQLHPITSEVIHLYSSVDSVCDCFGVSAVDVLKAVTSRPTGKLEGFLWQLRDDSDTDYCDSRVNEGQAILQSLRFRVASSSIREADPAIPELRSSYQLPSGPRPQPHIVTSTVSCPAKLLKLKGELLNILFVFPEKVLRWPDQDPSVEAEINAAGETAALQVYSSAAKYTSSGQVPPSSIDLSPENIDRLADKAARKAKRRLRRKISIDNFVKSVQRASCAQQLLPLVSLLEQVVPNQLLFKSHFLWNEYCADSIISIAEVATRIYLLDRRIMFNELSGVENASLACPFRLRTQFIPRCAVNNCCTRGLGHQGKCSYGPNTFSRFPDHFQLAPPQDPFSQQHATPLPSQSRATIMPTQPSRAISRPREEDPLQTLSTFLERAHIDIEQMQPYVPTYSEVAVSEWL